MNGSKIYTEAADSVFIRIGRRALYGRYKPYRKERWRPITGDYAGMSNDKTGENPVRRKPKVSWGR